MGEEKTEQKKEKTFTPYQKKPTCPKCGPGVHLANHKSRLSCGKCGYMEVKQ